MARIERLRSFLISHPPLVVFIFCIGMTAVAFVSFAYYIKFNNVKNIEVQRDWNTILYNATQVDFCSTSNKSLVSSQFNNSYMSDHGYLNVSLRLNVAMHLPKGYNRAEPVVQLLSNFNSSILGYQGHLSTRVTFLTFSLFNPLAFHCQHKNGCMVIQPACVTITAPQEIFPTQKPWPTSCSVETNGTFEPVVFNAQLRDGVVTARECSSVLMKINHQEDERLIVYLTVESRSLVHEHLMRSSYFLFIVIVIILAFGFFRGSLQYHDRKPGSGYILT